jgi:2-dehydro-3-deoxygalactonokinase
MTASALIAIDWGTSNRRAWRLDRAGAVLDGRHDNEGLLAIKEARFAESLRGMVGDWLAQAPGVPVLMAGMVGSKRGWVEAPYLSAPLELQALGQHLHPVAELAGSTVRVVPGVCLKAPDRAADVMRGEETQIYGALALSNQNSALLLLPGTHAKWADVKNGVLREFRTYMTGELFTVLRKHSILGQLMEGESFAEEAFFHGLRVSRQAGPGGLLHDLFSVRTLRLFEQLFPTAGPSYLSGLLIGAELVDACRHFPQAAGETILTVGSAELSALYQAAAREFGLTLSVMDNDALFPAAMYRIAGSANLL